MTDDDPDQAAAACKVNESVTSAPNSAFQRTVVVVFAALALFLGSLAICMFVDSMPSHGRLYLALCAISLVIALANIEGTPLRDAALWLIDAARQKGLSARAVWMFLFTAAFFYIVNVVAGTIVFADAFEADFGALAAVCLVVVMPAMAFGTLGFIIVPLIEAAAAVWFLYRIRRGGR